MTENFLYRTICESGHAEQIIKKSKFIGIFQHVESEEDVQNFLDEQKKTYPNATHYCLAYILGTDKNPDRRKAKSSNDGEPSGSAGNPMLDVLRYRNLTNAAVIVVRYFGGIKLGVGGLVRAYGQTAALAFENAKTALCILVRRATIEMDYANLATVEYSLRDKKEVVVCEKNYLETVSLKIFLKNESESFYKNFCQELFDKTMRLGKISIHDDGLEEILLQEEKNRAD